MTDPTSNGPPSGPRVVLVEDHELLAQSLAFALQADGFAVSRCTDLSFDAVLSAVTSAPPDLVLLDLDLGASGSSLPLIGDLVGRGALVVMLTGVTDRVRLAECVEAGAVGVVDKADPFERLVSASREVLERRTLLSAAERAELLAELRRHRAAERERMQGFDQLSRREAVVLQGLVDGRSAEEIASSEYVSLNTVRTQIRSTLNKLGVRSQLAAVSLARKAGWSHDGG
jgi:DNA-binding NarL/FixJ family response regulator